MLKWEGVLPFVLAQDPLLLGLAVQMLPQSDPNKHMAMSGVLA